MRHRYWNPPQAAVVPREVAQQIARERDALARELERTRQELRVAQSTNARLTRQALPPRDDERVRAAIADLRDEVKALQIQLEQTETAASEVRRERDEARAARDALRGERDLWLEERAELTFEVEQRDEALEASATELRALREQLEAVAGLDQDVKRLRRRRDEDVRQATHNARRALLQGLFELGDTIDLALSNSACDPDDPWYQGMQGIQRQFHNVLEREGLSRVGEVGEAFDPGLHEAVGLGQAETSGQILHVQRVGYRFEDDSLARPAQVIVSR